MAYQSQPQSQPSIFNIFFKQSPTPPPQSHAQPRVATLQRKQLDPLDCTLEKLDTGVDRRRARLQKLEQERAQASQQALAYKRAGQHQLALKSAQQVRDCDLEIKQLEALVGRLRLETRQLNYAKEASDTNALIKEAVHQKSSLLHGLDVVDVEDTAEASGRADGDLEQIFDRLAGPLEDPQQASYENEALLAQLEQDARSYEAQSAHSSSMNTNTASSTTGSGSSSQRGGTMVNTNRAAYSLDDELPF